MLARKFFSRRVTIPAATATSYATLMRGAAAVTGTPAWGTNSDGSISMDSFTGDGATFIPVTEAIYVGYDAQVTNADAASTYAGVPCAVSIPYNLTDYCRGIVDTETVWLYSVNQQSVDLIFVSI